MKLIPTLLALALAGTAAAAELATAPVRSSSAAAPLSFDGVVEAQRQTVVAAQVSGAIVQLEVKVGDRVRAGQLLARIDARTAEQTANAGAAQANAARATLEVARREFERQQQLARERFISTAALDRAEADYKARKAEADAQIAQAGAARTMSGLHQVLAPYAGVVAEVPVALGDMAAPGRPLLTLYDPAALRVTAALPLSVATQPAPGATARVELPQLPEAQRWLNPARVQTLPTADASTHTMTVRADLPAGTAAAPGQFARLWWPTTAAAAGAGATLAVPQRAVLRRGELQLVYVVGADGKPLLRQVRLGRADAATGQVEVLAGLMPNERVALEPQAAAQVR